MSVLLRQGIYGDYYGNDYNSSNTLDQEKQQLNAKYIYSYLSNKGWTLNAISGLLGNMQSESAINPGRWQSDNVGDLEAGYGLVQWTPATKYIDFIGVENDPSTMDNNLSRIIYEVENNLQWIATTEYNYSFEEFTKSLDTPYNLAMAFLHNYERPADPNQPDRGTQANTWYEYLSGYVPPDPPTPTPTKKKKYKPYNLFLRRVDLYF